MVLLEHCSSLNNVFKKKGNMWIFMVVLNFFELRGGSQFEQINGSPNCSISFPVRFICAVTHFKQNYSTYSIVFWLGSSAFGSTPTPRSFIWLKCCMNEAHWERDSCVNIVFPLSVSRQSCSVSNPLVRPNLSQVFPSRSWILQYVFQTYMQWTTGASMHDILIVKWHVAAT